MKIKFNYIINNNYRLRVNLIIHYLKKFNPDTELISTGKDFTQDYSIIEL